MNSIISVIIPIYNVERFLPRCLDSVISQTFKNIEVILIDDGSTDESGTICDLYAQNDPRVKVIHKPNEGVSAARNTGLSEAKGDYVTFIDGDDFIHPLMLEFLYAEICNHDCSFSMVLEENVTENDFSITNLQVSTYSKEIINKNDCIFKLTHGGKEKSNFVHLLGKLYKKDLLSGIEFDKTISLSEDFLFNMEFYLKNGNGVRILEPMYFRTLLRTDSLSSRKPTDMIYNAEIYLKSLSLIPFDETIFQSYVLENIMNKIVNFKRRNKNTNLHSFAQSKSKTLFNSIKKEFWKNKEISMWTKLKYTFYYFIV